ncbi:FtsK/SpoIIIE domain-containing protein [Cellulosimicrobium sp. SJTW-1]|uniref:FtsK/SpoIIIE domain-containing protein n=1 Tax=Cellulosimicrobium sp. SJTW-1 TaxID=3078082 RepID=UPI0039E9FE27
MSTSTEHAARIIADALIECAARSSDHRRLFASALLDLPLTAVFKELESRCDSQVVVSTPSVPVSLAGIKTGGTELSPILVPYLVDEVPRQNRGSGGFAALLRDEVPVGEGAPRVLLVLDRRPVETVQTAAEDVSEAPELRWRSLRERAIEPASGSVRTLLKAVLTDDEEHSRLARSGETLGELTTLASRRTVAEAGLELHRLGAYIADPAVEVSPSRATRKRLKANATWRTKLESWSAPDQDLVGKLSAEYQPGAPGLNRVLDSRGPFGLDFALFTMSDLPLTHSGDEPPSRFASPPRVGGAACATSTSTVVAWTREPQPFSVGLQREATTPGEVTVDWSGGETSIQPIEVGDLDIELTPPGSGWNFGRVTIHGGGSISVAVLVEPGSWAPIEASLELDLDAAAFRCSEEPELLAIGAGGQLLGPARIVQGEPVPNSERTSLTVEFDGTRRVLPVLVVAAADETPADDPKDEPDDPDGPDDGPLTDPVTPDEVPDGDPKATPAPADPEDPFDDGALTGVVATVAHARLMDSKTGSVGEQTSFRVVDGVGKILTPRVRELADQTLDDGLSGLSLEAQILASPDVLVFQTDRTGGEPVLRPLHALDSLEMSGTPVEKLSVFMDARRALFAALSPYGSAHALAAGVARDEASLYVASYSELLLSLTESGRFRAEFERVVLADAVFDAVSGDVFIAPTNPVTVRYLIELTETIDSWLPRSSEVIDADLATLSPRYLVPIFHTSRTWYEIAHASRMPLLWRRYGSMSLVNPGDDRPAYIARRINHFLRVHPEYRDPRQKLALSFYEAGQGKAVLDALRRLVKPSTTRTSPPTLPQLEVLMVSANAQRSELEAALRSSTTGGGNAEDRVLRDIVTIRHLTPDEARKEWSHIGFVFQSSLDRAPKELTLSTRSSTLFCRGLGATPGRVTDQATNETSFHWGTFTGNRQLTPLGTMVKSVLELVGGMPRDMVERGRTRVPSTVVERRFLGDVYENSAWVVHLDRLLGLEAFAPDASGKQARYLIDYEDRADPGQPGLDAITATNRVQPYRLALQRALARYGRASEGALDRLLQIFNGVSGQWALDIVGANVNDLHERIGLAVAIAALSDLDEAFTTGASVGLVLPLREIIYSLPLEARPPGGRITDDLLYLRVPLGTQGPVRISGRVIEVKFRGATDQRTVEYAREQLTNTYEWLQATFGPEDTPRRLFRARDLSEFIRAAAVRSQSFGLVKIGDRAGFEDSIDAIASGSFTLELDYNVGYTRVSGDFLSIEADNGVAVHRQWLAGEGKVFGHIRLGREAITAIITGQPLPKPTTWPSVTFGATVERVDPAPQPAPEDGRPSPGAAAPMPAGSSSEDTAEQGAGRASSTPPTGEVRLMAGRLDEAFAKYGLGVEPFAPDTVQVGPSVLRFRTRTLGRLSITDVERRARDIGREIAAVGEVQVGDEPGFVTIDVPRSERTTVPIDAALAELDRHRGEPGALSFVAGVAPSGEYRIADLARLPHLLVAGATGSGKSVFLRGLLIELLHGRSANQLNLMIVDPKRLDFAPFAAVPHLRGTGIISNAADALTALQETLEREIERRLPIIAGAGVSSAAEFYEADGSTEDLPQLVILVDEFADLVLAGHDRKSFSELIQRFAQLTRAYGIYLVLATQRPSVDVITGSIKANLTARMAFSLPSARDSMTILDRGGAEDLLGNGDLLFYRNGRVERLQAPFASGRDVVRHLAE